MTADEIDNTDSRVMNGERWEIGGFIIEDRGPLFTSANDDDDEKDEAQLPIPRGERAKVGGFIIDNRDPLFAPPGDD